jgi:DNA primase
MTVDFNAVKARHSLVEVVARYTELKRKGTEYVGHCLFHNDSSPSMTIYRGHDGSERYRCFACGAGSEGGDVIDFIAAVENVDKLEAVRRLEGEEMPMPSSRPPRVLPPDEGDAWECIVPVPDDAPPYDPARTYNPKQAAEKCYKPTLVAEYRQADGGLIGHIVRLEFADGEKICPVITYCVGPRGQRRWCAKRPKPPYPLVGVEQLAQFPGKAVLLVEGEKKRAIAARELPGFVVLSLLGGAEAVKVNDLKPLRTRNVVLWPDADPPGRRAMREVAERIA